MVHSPQGPLFMGFPRQEYCSGLLFPPPGDSPQPRDQIHVSFIAGGFFPAEPPGKNYIHTYKPARTFSLLKSIRMICFKHSLKVNRWKKIFFEYLSTYYFWCASFFPGNLSYYLVSFSFLLKNCLIITCSAVFVINFTGFVYLEISLFHYRLQKIV